MREQDARSSLMREALPRRLTPGRRPSPGAAMPETFILIPGRTSRQGCGISEGKFGHEYQEETHVLQVSPQDMERLGLAPGDRVRLRSDSGQIEVAVTPSRGE